VEVIPLRYCSEVAFVILVFPCPPILLIFRPARLIPLPDISLTCNLSARRFEIGISLIHYEITSWQNNFCENDPASESPRLGQRDGEVRLLSEIPRRE
jgi:hypothetical protein